MGSDLSEPIFFALNLVLLILVLQNVYVNGQLSAMLSEPKI